MTLSLDTYTLLWWLEDPQLLSEAARKAIGDGKNTVYVSAVVVWEIVIKRALGKLDAPDDLEGGHGRESVRALADHRAARPGRAVAARSPSRPFRPPPDRGRPGTKASI